MQYWISWIKLELHSEHATINLSTWRGGYSSICPNLHLVSRKDSYVITISGHRDCFMSVRSARSGRLVNWGGGRMTSGATVSSVKTTFTAAVCRVVREHREKSKVKFGHITRATPRSVESISQSSITYFDVYLRDSPWKPITRCSV